MRILIDLTNGGSTRTENWQSLLHQFAVPLVSAHANSAAKAVISQQMRLLLPAGSRGCKKLSKRLVPFCLFLPPKRRLRSIDIEKLNFIRGERAAGVSFDMVVSCDEKLVAALRQFGEISTLTLKCQNSETDGTPGFLISDSAANSLLIGANNYSAYEKIIVALASYHRSGVLDQGLLGDPEPPTTDKRTESDRFDGESALALLLRRWRKLKADPIMFMFDSRLSLLRQTGVWLAYLMHDPLFCNRPGEMPTGSGATTHSQCWLQMPGSRVLLKPVNGLQFRPAAGGYRWLSSSSGSGFQIMPGAAMAGKSPNVFAGGWVRISFCLSAVCPVPRPRLTFATSPNSTQLQSVELPVSESNVVDFCVDLPNGVDRLSLIVLGAAGPFRIKSLRLHKVQAATAKEVNLKKPKMAPLAGEHPDYSAWYSKYGRLSLLDRWQILRYLKGEELVVPVSVLVMPGDPDRVQKSVHSLKKQFYPVTQVLLPEENANDFEGAGTYSQETKIGELPGVAEGYILFLSAGDELPETAVLDLATACRDSTPAVVYGDHHQCLENGAPSYPWLKPDWDPLLYRRLDYFSSAAMVHCGAIAADTAVPCTREHRYQFYQQTVSGQPADQIVHVPQIVCAEAYCGTQGEQGSGTGDVAGTIALPKGQQQRSGLHPRVTIIVPTRDGQMLDASLTGLLSNTAYSDFEILIVDNQSKEAATLAILQRVKQDPRVAVIDFNAPFNYAAIINMAAERASGEILALINDDVTVLTSDWLTEMVVLAMRPDVGAVGARLLYSDGRIQHAGVVLGMGGSTGHVYRYAPGDCDGNMHVLRYPHCVSAVTGACLVLAKDLFHEVGGMDAVNLTVGFNDVDLCLKLGKSGYLNVLNPVVALCHHESLTRGVEDTAEKIVRAVAEEAVMRKRWGTALHNDPYYNSSLSLSTEQCRLARPPRSARPWKNRSWKDN